MGLLGKHSKNISDLLIELYLYLYLKHHDSDEWINKFRKYGMYTNMLHWNLQHSFYKSLQLEIQEYWSVTEYLP